MNENQGANKLAHVLQGRMNQVTGAYVQDTCDFGTIQSDMSLVTNLFPTPIPQGSYVVCRQLTLGDTGEELTDTESGDSVKIPEKMNYLKPGDRVFVCWVQNDPVIVDKIGE